MNNALTQYAKAAQVLPMAWLAQAEFPSKDVVKKAFRIAVSELPEATAYEDNVVRSALQAIADGPDPRGGRFEKQAIYAAGQLHDRVVRLVLQP